MVTIGTRFNSLQTGKRIQRKIKGDFLMARLDVSIPFKRESVSKGRMPKEDRKEIKFQFPSNGKAYPKRLPVLLSTGSEFGFNSLQTGKRIQSEKRKTPLKNLIYVSIPFKRESVSKEIPKRNFNGLSRKFQFPSNGKAYPKKNKRGFSYGKIRCFNSLQTGKRIQRQNA